MEHLAAIAAARRPFGCPACGAYIEGIEALHDGRCPTCWAVVHCTDGGRMHPRSIIGEYVIPAVIVSWLLVVLCSAAWAGDAPPAASAMSIESLAYVIGAAIAGAGGTAGLNRLRHRGEPDRLDDMQRQINKLVVDVARVADIVCTLDTDGDGASLALRTARRVRDTEGAARDIAEAQDDLASAMAHLASIVGSWQCPRT